MLSSVCMIKVAQTYAKINQLEEAVRCYQRVLKRDPEDLQVLLEIGVTQIRMKATDEGIKHLVQVYEMQPRNP